MTSLMNHLVIACLWCTVTNTSIAQWIPIGHPVSANYTIKPIGDSLIYSVFDGNLVVSPLGETTWDYVLTEDEPINVFAFDTAHAYFTIGDRLHRVNRFTKEVTSIQDDRLDPNLLVFHDDIGLVTSDTSRLISFYSRDFGTTWDTMLTTEDIGTIPDHFHTGIVEYREDIHGHFFILYESNWQTHVVIYTHGRKPIELTNNWYGYLSLIMDGDSTLFYNDANGIHFLPRGEKFEKDIRVQSGNYMVFPDDLLYANGDTLLLLHNEMIYRSSDLGVTLDSALQNRIDWFLRTTPYFGYISLGSCGLNQQSKLISIPEVELIKETKPLISTYSDPELYQLSSTNLYDDDCGHYSVLQKSGNWQVIEKDYNMVAEFRGRAYAFLDKNILWSEDFTNWTKVKFALSEEPEISHFSTSNISDREFWISFDSVTMITTDNVTWQKVPRRIDVNGALAFDKNKWLVWSSWKWFKTEDGGQTFSEEDDLPRTWSFVSTENEDHFIVNAHNDEVVLHQINSNFEVIRDVLIDTGECTTVNVISTIEDNIIVLIDDRINLVNTKTEVVSDISHGISEMSDFWWRQLVKTDRGTVYLINPGDQIYLWAPSKLSGLSHSTHKFWTLQNPFVGHTQIVVPEEFRDSQLNFHIYSTEGQKIKTVSSTNQKLVPLSMDAKGLFVVQVIHENKSIGHIKIISK